MGSFHISYWNIGRYIENMSHIELVSVNPSKRYIIYCGQYLKRWFELKKWKVKKSMDIGGGHADDQNQQKSTKSEGH